MTAIAYLQAAPKGQVATEFFTYIGTYTGPQSQGIYGFKFGTTGPVFAPASLVAPSSNPSFLVVHPNGMYIYAANENAQGQISSFVTEAGSGKLLPLNSVSSRGAGPCHIALDRGGKFLLAANYDSGSVAVYRINGDGSLGESTAFIQHQGSSVNKDRQAGPHAHFITTAPDNRFVLVSDLGLDEVLVYRFDDKKGTLEANDTPFWKDHPGAGPRHLVFSPSGKFVYVVNEMASNVTALSFDAHGGVLKELQTISALPADFHGENTGAEIAVDAAGKFVYASNRGNDTIAVFAVHNGRLQLIQNASTLGKEPRHFAVDPSGSYLFAENQNSNNIAILRVDPKRGMLQPTGTMVPVPSPVCVVFATSR